MLQALDAPPRIILWLVAFSLARLMPLTKDPDARLQLEARSHLCEALAKDLTILPMLPLAMLRTVVASAIASQVIMILQGLIEYWK